jgi:hypothetical protein
MAMEMKGRALMRDRLQSTVWRLTRSVFIIYGETPQKRYKKAQKGHIWGLGWFKVRFFYLSCLSFVPVYGERFGSGLVIGKGFFKGLFSQGNGEIAF